MGSLEFMSMGSAKDPSSPILTPTGRSKDSPGPIMMGNNIAVAGTRKAESSATSKDSISRAVPPALVRRRTDSPHEPSLKLPKNK